jgi:hypothetical protein
LFPKEKTRKEKKKKKKRKSRSRCRPEENDVPPCKCRTSNRRIRTELDLADLGTSNMRLSWFGRRELSTVKERRGRETERERERGRGRDAICRRIFQWQQWYVVLQCYLSPLESRVVM